MSNKRQTPFRGFGRGQVRTLSWEYGPDEHEATHRHDWHQLVYAVKGVMTVETPHGSWVVPTYRAVWVPARVDHAIRMSGRVAMRTLYFSPRVAGWLPAECRVVSVPPLVHELLLHVVALGSLDRRIPRQRHVMAVLLDQLRELPADPLHVPEVRDVRARRVSRRVLEEPGLRSSLDTLAKESGGSKRTIERAFELDTGMTFGRWRQHVRLVHALRLLGAGHSVTSVALEVGYDSVSAFVHAFRANFGTTPGRYYGPQITYQMS